MVPHAGWGRNGSLKLIQSAKWLGDPRQPDADRDDGGWGVDDG